MATVQHHMIITCKPRDVNLISTIEFKSATPSSPRNCSVLLYARLFPSLGWSLGTRHYTTLVLAHFLTERRQSPANTTPYRTRELCIWHAGNVAAENENNYQRAEKAPLHAIDS